MLPPKKTLRRYEVEGTARFLTFSCYRRHRLFDNEQIKAKFVERLTNTAVERDIEILAWVVMPEHVHLVVWSESTPIGKWLSALKRPFSIEVLARWRELDAAVIPRLRDRRGDPHFWQAGGGYDRNVIGRELLEKIRYCHRNPVTSGLVTKSAEWPWSSARRYENRADAIGPQVAFELLPPSRLPLT